jgi:hypothetical protein
MTMNLDNTSSLELEQQQKAIEKAESFDVETLSSRSSNSNSSDGNDESLSTSSSTMRRKAVVLSTTLVLIIVITAVVLGLTPSYGSSVFETSNKDALNPTGNTTDEKQYNNSDTTTSWPELVGMPGEDVKLYLEDLDPLLRVYLVPLGSLVTMDYREDRVWVYVNEDGIVMATPKIGR